MTHIRRTLEVVLAVYVVVVLGLTVAAHLAPALGHGLFAIRSASMAPALSVGDLVVTERVPAAVLRPGDVLTIRLSNGTLVTHRAIAVEATDDGPVLRLRGDANATTDPFVVDAEQVQGRLAGSIAGAGYLLAMLSIPSGIVALLSLGAALLTVIWLMDPLDDEEAAELEELIGLLAAESIAGRVSQPSLAPR